MIVSYCVLQLPALRQFTWLATLTYEGVGTTDAEAIAVASELCLSALVADTTIAEVLHLDATQLERLRYVAATQLFADGEQSGSLNAPR